MRALLAAVGTRGDGDRQNEIQRRATRAACLEQMVFLELLRTTEALSRPLAQLMKSEDLSSTQYAVFLASEESSFITGIDLPVDGGLVAV